MVQDADRFGALMRRQDLAGFTLEPMPPLTLRDRYYDTGQGDLLARGLMLRVREQEGQATATLREFGESERGRTRVQQVLDWEVDPAAGLPDGPVLRSAREFVGDMPLAEIVGFRQYRTPRGLYDRDRIVGILLLDVVAYDFEPGMHLSNEVELELVREGNAGDHARVEEALQGSDLERDARSKFERAVIRVGQLPGSNLFLLPDEREALERLAASGSPGLQRRARAILLDAEGAPTRTISDKADLSPSRVRHWKSAFRQQRMAVFEQDAGDDAPDPATPANEGAPPVEIAAPTPTFRVSPIIEVDDAPAGEAPSASDGFEKLRAGAPEWVKLFAGFGSETTSGDASERVAADPALGLAAAQEPLPLAHEPQPELNVFDEPAPPLVEDEWAGGEHELVQESRSFAGRMATGEAAQVILSGALERIEAEADIRRRRHDLQHLRGVLLLTRALLPVKSRERLQRSLRRAGRVVEPARVLDAAVRRLQIRAQDLDPGEQAAHQAVHIFLSAERARAMERLERSEALAQLRSRLRECIEELGADTGDARLEHMLASTIWHRYEALRRAASAGDVDKYAVVRRAGDLGVALRLFSALLAEEGRRALASVERVETTGERLRDIGAAIVHVNRVLAHWSAASSDGILDPAPIEETLQFERSEQAELREVLEGMIRELTAPSFRRDLSLALAKV
jgi:hypothetical protein